MTLPQTQLVPVSQLKVWDENPRTINDDRFKKLCESIQADPDFLKLRPILATLDNRVFAGNMRLRAVQALGWKEVPAILVDIPEKLAQERALKDNNQFGDWQDEGLQEILHGLATEGSDLTLLGFDDAELTRLLDSITLEDVKEDEAPAPPVEPKSKLGDLYQLGTHRLLCEDATKIEDVERLMGGEKADMVFTDPPYNVDYGAKNEYLNSMDRGNRKTTGIENDKMTDGNFYEFLLTAFGNMSAFTNPGGAIYICHADSEGVNFRRAMTESGFLYKQCIIWSKNNLVLGRQDYQWKHEPILYGWKDGASHYFVDDRTQTTIWELDKPHKSDEHPTMKPLALCSKAILKSSLTNALVLDLFGGSGSTLMPCEQTGRRCFMQELDPRYVDVIVARWEKLTGGKAVLLA